ncbi:hypothetical protein D3C75_914490 [compost metagenome]
MLVALREPYLEALIQLLQGLRLLQGDFAQKRIDDLVKPFDLPFGFRRVGFGIEQPGSELGTGPGHGLGAVLLAVVKIDRLRYPILLDRLAKRRFDQPLVHDRHKLPVQNKPCSVVNEHDQIHLFHRLAFAKRQIRPVFQV